MFSLESPHRGDSNVYTRYTIFIIKRKSPQIILNLQLMYFFFSGIQEQVRNSCGKRASSVLATDVLLYIEKFCNTPCYKLEVKINERVRLGQTDIYVD